MFHLKEQKAKLNHVNGRVEKNVEERAFDLKITVEMHNTVLNMFHDHLLDAFYKVDPEADMVDAEKGHRTLLKFLKLAPVHWGHEMVECGVTIGYGIGGASDILLNGCKVNNFVFTLKEGGTVSISLRIIAHPDPDDIAKLFELMQQEITLSINPPDPKTAAELFDK